MSYHIVEITKKSDILKIIGFEERNPYIYPQDDQIQEFEIIISGVRHFKRRKLYRISKTRIIYNEVPYKGENVRKINSFVKELIDSNYRKLQKVLFSILETKQLRHFIIQDQDCIVDILSNTEPVIRMDKEGTWCYRERINESVK